MEIDPAEYISAIEAAERLHVTPETVRAWARTGRIRAHRLPGGRWLIHRDVIKTTPPK